MLELFACGRTSFDDFVKLNSLCCTPMPISARENHSSMFHVSLTLDAIDSQSW